MNSEKIAQAAEIFAKDMRLSPTERADLLGTASKLAGMASDDLRNFAQERRLAAFKSRHSNPTRTAELALAEWTRLEMVEEMPPPPSDDSEPNDAA